MQRATWANVPSPDVSAESKDPKNVVNELAQRAEIAFVDVGRDGVDNLAVTDLGIEAPFITTGMEVPVVATVQNYGQQPRRNLRIELQVGKRVMPSTIHR